ncbi:MAG: antirestriction protein ArdA [Clostridia bacterium]
MESRIYIADLNAYNSGFLKGDWIELPTEKEEIEEIIKRHTNNGQTDFAIHDYELDFEISEYDDPFKINELVEMLEELDLNKYLIKHLEFAYGIDIKKIDVYDLKQKLDDVYKIDASNDKEFAQNYFYECYGNQIEELPWELSYSIDWDTVFSKLEMTMSITENEEDSIYYYSNN